MNPWIERLVSRWEENKFSISWVHQPAAVPTGELCFILNCSKLVKPDVLQRHCHNLVVHASDLPKGKGWSPWTWQILEGKNRIPLTLFEAVEAVDSGTIYLQQWIDFEGHELIGEIRDVLATTIISMCERFVELYPEIIACGKEQKGEESFYPRRRQEDSSLDIDKTIREQFELLRVVDNERYPAYFDYNGFRYTLKIEKS